MSLPTLAYRRLRGDMIECYKILTGKYDLAVSSDLFQRSLGDRTRGHLYKLEKQRVRLDKRKYSFFVRVINPWNSLPAKVVEAPSVQAFEGRLDKFWADHPIRFSL